MDGSRFDRLTKTLGQGASRRTVLKGFVGIGGAATVAELAFDDAEAARRPAPTPKPDTCPGNQQSMNGVCACTDGLTACGPDCCTPGQSVCCDNACCFGTCYGEELCCPTGYELCEVAGCCDGRCTNGGQTCCSFEGVCGEDCCDLATERCCAGDGGAVCIASGSCCDDLDCTGGTCQAGVCVPFPPDPPDITFEPLDRCRYRFTATGLEPNKNVDFQVFIDNERWLWLIQIVDGDGKTSFPPQQGFCGENRTLEVRVSTLEFEPIVSESLTYTCAC
jgi:hypothetical protein